MVTLYVNSRKENSGKSTLIMGLALRMIKDRYKIGFMKPIGKFPVQVGDITTDQDALFIKSILNLDESLEQICPVIKTFDFIQDVYADKKLNLAEKIVTNFNQISAGKDIVILEGSKNIFEGSFIGLTGVDITNMLKCKVLILDEYITDQLTADFFMSIKKTIGNNLIGAVINKINPDDIDYANKKLVPYLKRKGIDVIGLIPDDKLLSSVSVKMLTEILSGKVLCCEDKLDELVENFVVGAMGMESALKYFRKITNKAVITGGDRADIQIAALETSIKCIILTGGIIPNQIVISRAQEKGVPIISVRSDTFTIIETLEHKIKKLEIREKEKINQITTLMEKAIDFDKFYKSLGLK